MLFDYIYCCRSYRFGGYRVWTAVDIAGAAYRVTIPAVIAVAALRQKHLYGDMGEKIFDK